MSDEFRKWIPGYKNRYMATRDGQIISYVGKSERILKPQIHNHGYRTVTLRKSSKSKSYLVHRLVLLTFVGKCPKDKNTNHRDGDPTNNNLTNLEYTTRYENQMHAIKHGLQVFPPSWLSSKSLFNPEQIRFIREKAITGWSQKELAEFFIVHKKTISQILTRRSYNDVT